MTDRNEPLRLMDEIENRQTVHCAAVMVPRSQLKFIRTALEAQRDELAQEKQKIRAFCEGLEVDEIERLLAHGQPGDFRRLGTRMTQRMEEIFAQKDARIARLERALSEIVNPIPAMQERAKK